MRAERYEMKIAPTFMSYEFISEGPKGSISKLVKYTETRVSGIYNLGFGDKLEDGDEFDDKSISDNKDSLKVLATVAATVFSFTEQYKDVLVFATGSTSARTRLYRIGISNNLEEIEQNFIVQGYIDNRWELFRKNRNYSAFLINKK
jgi:hypothetical protein